MTDKRMGEVFAQDRIPLPREDPRYGTARLRDIYDQVLPGGQLSRDAGVLDIGSRRYGPLGERYMEPGEEELAAMREGGLRRIPVINSMANPELFRAAQQNWPESPNAVWMFDDRFRGM